MTTTTFAEKPIVPPFTPDDAIRKVRPAEDAWNLSDPARVTLAYSKDSVSRNRSEFVVGRPAIPHVR